MNIGKRIAGGIALAMLWAAAALIVATHTGCASVTGIEPRHSEAADTVTRIATYAYIRAAGDPPSQVRKAARIRAVVAELERTAAGEPLTLQRFAALALERLPGDLTPADRAMAAEFINLLGSELGKSIGLGGLESDSRMRLQLTLRAVDQAAAFFAPASKAAGD